MRCICLLILAASVASYAEDPFSCVDSAVADAFLAGPYQERAQYSTSIPDGFITLAVPEGLSLVGSKVEGSGMSVVYKASMDPGPALAAAVGAMAQSGWVENEGQAWGMSGGFRDRSQPVATMLCHDEEPGALSIMSVDRSQHTLVTYAHYAEVHYCTQAPGAARYDGPLRMMRLLPNLTLPEGVEATNSGSGGGTGEVSSHVDLSGGMGRSDLQTYFEEQVRNQKWEFQTGWSSGLSSGSIWTRSSKSDGILIGTLHLFDSGSDPIRVRFDISPAVPATRQHNENVWTGLQSGAP